MSEISRLRSDCPRLARVSSLRWALLALCMSVAAAPARGQCALQAQEHELAASDAAALDYFGTSVSVSGDTAVVGAPYDDDAGSISGSVYVYIRSGGVWTQQQKLVASDAAANDYFGYTVSANGDTVVVGAVGDNNAGGTDAGSAYVFVRSGTTWTQQQKLTASDASAGDQFGSSVSASGDTIVIGAKYEDNTGGLAAGSAYVFVRSGTVWTQQQKLTAFDGAADDWFGQSVSVEGDIAVVGAYPEFFAGNEGGAAYIFVRSGGVWTLQQKLTAADATSFTVFGISVSVSGDTVVVGAPGDNDAGSDSGSAYIFVRSAGVWTQQQKLTALDASAGDLFGYSVSLSGDTVVVGAYAFDFAFDSSDGSAYVFVRSGGMWNLQQKLVALDIVAGDIFGTSVSVSGDTAVIGAPLHDSPGRTDAGSAYVYDGVTVWAQQKLTASDGAEFDHFGTSVSVSEDTAVVGATGDDDAGPESGSAYVFARSGGAWTQRQKLTASDAAAGDEFGSSVAVSGDTVMVGANRGGGVTTDSGSAYVYVRSGAMWTQQQELTASDGAQFDDFGWSVSVDGNTAVVGAYGLAAYVFVRSGAVWTQQQKLTPSDSPSGFFGASVSVSGDTAVVGAYYDDDAGARSGSAYVFVRSGGVWTQQQKLTASNAAPGAEFGYSVSVSGETIVVGAAATGGGVARPAYVYVRNGGVWTEQQKLTGSGGGNFGNSVSVSGDIAIIGEFQHHGNSGGSAYIFVRSGVVWVLAQSLLTPDGVDGGAFGSSVSVNGDTAVVGAPGHYELGMIGVGSAYVFSCASPPSCVDAKDCNNHGTCDNGTCMCNSGWTGTDCATPAAEIPAASTWGLVALILAVATAGTCVLRRPRVAWHSALSRVTT